MNQPLDNFFREKLEHAHKPAPAAAWDRIDAGLAGRQRKGLWLKIAASLLIVATASFILWPHLHDDTTRMADRTVPQAKQPAHKAIPHPGAEQHQQQAATTPALQAPAVAMTPAPAAKTPQKKHQPTAPAMKDKPGQPEQVQQQLAYQSHSTSPVTAEPAPVHESVMPIQPAPASVNVVLAEIDNQEETDDAVTLVYSADEINEKYLDKEALAKATSAQKKPSTFRKLLEKAYDLKNNQDPMGGLRQRKNEILALSFKSEKRSQNK